eukprot:g6801.t1
MAKLNVAGSSPAPSKTTVTVGTDTYQVVGGKPKSQAPNSVELPNRAPNPHATPPPAAAPAAVAAADGPKFAGWSSENTPLVQMPGGQQPKATDAYCGVCGGPIAGQCLDVGGVNYHPQCFVCVACKQSLTGQILTVKDRFYHPGCMACQVCSRPLNGQEFVIGQKNGKPYCIEHASEGSGSAGTRNKLCEGCRKELLATHRTISANGLTWHQKCFICGECRTNLEGKQAVMMGKKAMCPGCHEEKFVTKCKGCGEAVKGQMMQLDGESGPLSYHPRCFRCKTCSKQLKDVQFYVVKDEVYCWDDANKANT